MLLASTYSVKYLLHLSAARPLLTLPRQLTAVSSLPRAGIAGFGGPSRPLGATKRPVLLHKIPNPEQTQPQFPSFHDTPWAASWNLLLRWIEDTMYIRGARTTVGQY